MHRHQNAIRAKLVPPRPRRYLLDRPKLSSRLLEARHYRLTIVQASTGYGKSTALVSALGQAPIEQYWYSITETDREPQLFLLHLIHAFRLHKPQVGESALELLEETGTTPRPHQLIIDALSNELVQDREEAILVLDDYHLVNPVQQINELIDHFLEVLPANLHLVIATRQRPNLETLLRWRVKGDLLEITQQDLAFSTDEIETLFRTQYDLTLNAGQVQRLAAETEGWIIALQLIWQSIQSGVAGNLDQILAELPRSLEDLFSYLAHDVLARQEVRIQRFLLHTSVLRQLDPAASDHLLGWDGSGSLLRELDEEGFFLVRLGDAYRYHHLFHDFLRSRTQETGQLHTLHARAAAFFRQQGDMEESIYHWLAAEEYVTAADMMGQVSKALVLRGRLDTMSEWVTALPPAVLERFPILMVHMGELCRFSSRFDEALAWYEQAKERYLIQRDVAGASRALRGQAAIYLDTVRPIKATSLLQEALSLVEGQSDREERASLLDLLAENMTNRGKWEQAEALRHQSRELREEGPAKADLGVRVRLRTGRLDEALTILHERDTEEDRRLQADRFREPRSHRETSLLLSLIYAWQGLAEQALASARRGIELGRQLGSPFVEAVGHMRLGHAWQIAARPGAMDRALTHYQRAIEIGEQLSVARTQVEALWGLCRLYGFRQELDAAERSGRQGIELGQRAGDEWIVAHISAMLGASYVIAGREKDAGRHLKHSVEAFRDFGDPFGQTIARLWQCLLYLPDSARLLPALNELMELVESNKYEFIFSRLTFLGPPDLATLIPLLAIARQNRKHLAVRVLEEMMLSPTIPFYPGYTLRIQTLGRFAVRRGREAVSEGDWRRDKARQLLQLLIAKRDRFLQRDEIVESLWPEADGAAAESQFKVTLNALQQALEPERPPRAPTLFVQRRGSAYGLNPAAPVYLDAAEFERLITGANKIEDQAIALDQYRQALSLYGGDFLPDCLYQDFCRAERGRLARLYLTTLTRVAEMLLAGSDQDETADSTEEAIRLCEQILVKDNCWEAAYQHLIQAHLRQADRVQALRAYERCLVSLQSELGVAPMPETVALYQQALNSPL